jgi:hypothetical protein
VTDPRALEAVRRDLHARLLRTISTAGLERAALELGFDEQDRRHVEDFAIYEVRELGLTAAERLLQHHDLDPLSRTVLEAMVRARFVILEIDEVVDGTGVRGRDMLAETACFVADAQLSRTVSVGDLLATRLLTFDDFSLTTGAELRFDRSLAPTILEICERVVI